MAREGGGEREGERGDKNFVTYSHGEVRGGGGGGEGGEKIFFSALFLWVFCERDIICIRTQTHKGMLLKYAGGGGGEVDKIFCTVSWGWGGRFVSHVFHVFLRGGGNFLGGDQFCQTTTPTTPGRK